jgi:hypothetical protein
MKSVGFLTVVFVVIATFSVCLGYVGGRLGVSNGISVYSTGPTVTQIESLTELVTTRISISDVLVAEGEGYRGSWIIKGDGLIAIDLSRAKVADVDSKTRTARVTLPQPRVLSARVDHERSKTWSVEKTTWLPWAGNADAIRDQAMFHAQELVKVAAGSKDNIAQARYTAEKVLQSFYRMADWQVVIDWEPAQ